MFYNHSKTSPAPTERIWEKSWLCSVEKKRKTSVSGYYETQMLTTGLQSGETEVIWSSRRTPETSEGCIRSCPSSNYWANHIWQNASPPEKTNQPGAIGEWHIWTGCVAFRKRVVTEWFGSPRWIAEKHCDATNYTAKLQQTCHQCKQPGHYRNQCRLLKQEKDQARNESSSADNSNKNNGNGQTNSNSNNKVSNNTDANNTNNQKDRRPRPVYPHCETCGKTNHSTEKCYFWASAANRPPPRIRRPEGQNQVQQNNAQSNSDGNAQAVAQTLNQKRGAACNRPETNEISKLPPVPEVVWQQPADTITDQFNLKNTNIDSIIYHTQETSKTTVANQTSSTKGAKPQNHVITMEHPPRNQTGNEPVPFLNCSKNSPTDIQISEQHVTTTLTGDTTIPPLTATTPLIEEGSVRDEQTNEVYLPSTSSVILKRN